jgi:heme oxygenase-like protein
LHRRLRGALVGHFTAAEITTPPSAARMDRALGRLGAPETCRLFFTEHIEADAVHEQVMRRDVIGGLLDAEPDLAADVVFGVQATNLVEDRFADHVLGAWRDNRSSLRAAHLGPIGAP